MSTLLPITTGILKRQGRKHMALSVSMLLIGGLLIFGVDTWFIGVWGLFFAAIGISALWSGIRWGLRPERVWWMRRLLSDKKAVWYLQQKTGVNRHGVPGRLPLVIVFRDGRQVRVAEWVYSHTAVRVELEKYLEMKTIEGHGTVPPAIATVVKPG